MLASLPLIGLLFIVYNVIVFVSDAGSAQGAEAVAATMAVLDSELFTVEMISGAIWSFQIKDAILSVGLFLLFVEIVKATRTDHLSVINHGLSMLVFLACVVEFIIVPQAANSTFFIISLLALIDVVAGFSVTITTARRDFSVGAAG